MKLLEGFQSLPQEIVARICHFISKRKDLMSLSSTNQASRWPAQEKIFSDMSVPEGVEGLNRILRTLATSPTHANMVRSFSDQEDRYRLWDFAFEDGLIDLAASNVGLTPLQVYWDMPDRIQCMAELAMAQCRNIRHLSYHTRSRHGFAVLGKAARAAQIAGKLPLFPQLADIIVGGIPDMEDLDSLEIIAPNVRTIEAYGCTGGPKDSKLDKVSSLGLTECHTTKRDLEKWVNCVHNLTDFYYGECTKCTNPETTAASATDILGVLRLLNYQLESISIICTDASWTDRNTDLEDNNHQRFRIDDTFSDFTALKRLRLDALILSEEHEPMVGEQWLANMLPESVESLLIRLGETPLQFFDELMALARRAPVEFRSLKTVVYSSTVRTHPEIGWQAKIQELERAMGEKGISFTHYRRSGDQDLELEL